MAQTHRKITERALRMQGLVLESEVLRRQLHTDFQELKSEAGRVVNRFMAPKPTETPTDLLVGMARRMLLFQTDKTPQKKSSWFGTLFTVARWGVGTWLAFRERTPLNAPKP